MTTPYNLILGTNGDDNYDGAGPLRGTEGNDIIYGFAGVDYLIGDMGNDILYGGDGRDLIWGDEGDDVLIGGKGVDTLVGGEGNDLYIVDSGIDYIDEADSLPGVDTIHLTGVDINSFKVTYDQATDYNIFTAGDASTGIKGFQIARVEGITVEKISVDDGFTANLKTLDAWKFGTSANNTIHGTTGNDTILAGAGDDTIRGAAGNDTIHGGTGNDKLYGGTGYDFIHGGEGNDTLYGDKGNDTLYGGNGSDTLFGGAGKDTFAFMLETVGKGVDVVKDFVLGQDKVDLSDVLQNFNPLTQSIMDFVSVTNVGGNAIISVDVDGHGTANSMTTLVTLEAHDGMSFNAQAVLNQALIV